MYKLPEIDFSKATFLATETVQYHYGKHHKTYIDNLNKLTKDLPAKDLMGIIRTSDGGLYNNAAQSWNHTFYWLGLTPKATALEAGSKLAGAIQAQFQSEENLKTKFIESATAVFGSGWTWLAMNKATQKFEILNTGNAQVINTEKLTPIFVCDVWEHAYYIQFRNARAEYLNQFWAAINWKFAQTNFETNNLKVVSDLMQAP